MDSTQNTQNPSNQAPQIPPEIRTFIEGLLQDANMLNLDEQMHEEMINELFNRLDGFIASKIIDNLPPENVDEFIQMNEQKRPQEEIQQYLLDKMPNAQEVMTQAFAEFRELYLGNVAVHHEAQNHNPLSSTQQTTSQNNES